MAKVLWHGTCRALLLPWLMTALMAVLLAVIAITNKYAAPDEQLHGWAWTAPALTILVSTLLVHLFSRLTVDVTEEALVVRYGWGWPAQRFIWERVASVERIQVRPTEWGGWGYRMSARRRATAAVMRAGEGLKITFANDRVFVVTVDGAGRALEVIRGILSDPRHSRPR